MNDRNWTPIDGQNAWQHNIGTFIARVQLYGGKYYCSFVLDGQPLYVCGGGFDNFADATKHCIEIGEQMAMFVHTYSHAAWLAK